MPADELKREDYKPLGAPRKDPASRGGSLSSKGKKTRTGLSSEFDPHSNLINPLRNPARDEKPKVIQARNEEGAWIGAEVRPKVSNKPKINRDLAVERNDELRIAQAKDTTTPRKEPEKKQSDRIEEIALPQWDLDDPGDWRAANKTELAKDSARRVGTVGGKKEKKKVERALRDKRALSSDNWFARHGHTATYAGVFVFSFLVLVRPYETIPGLQFTASTAYFVALITLAIYIPTQISLEGNLSIMTVEVKAVLGLAFFGLLTIIFADDKALAWEVFNDSFIKAVLIFIIMVNVVRTRKRLTGLLWLSLLIGLYLTIDTVGRYRAGEFIEGTEEMRVAVDIGGLFGNPNDLALYMVMMAPIAIGLGLATRNKILKIFLFILGGLLIFSVIATQSRGGFLGLIAIGGVLAWKLGKNSRLTVSIVSIIVGVIVIALAPGNTGTRVLSIFIPGLDKSGSHSQRSELLEQSIWVTLRNPWGIGMGNFNIRSVQNLVSHNAYTQVSAELGLLGLLCYLIFLFNPLRKLGAIERTLTIENKRDWYYYVSIGLQASLVGYMVSSFFVSVAYNWYAFYLVAYAVSFRRIYMTNKGLEEGDKLGPGLRETIGLNIKAV